MATERIERLLYELEAKTTGFDARIAASRQEVEKLGAAAGGKGVPQVGALGGALTTLGTRSHGAREGMGKLQNAVIDFGKAAAGLPQRGPLGRLVEGLGLLTLGSPIVIGVAAAAAAIGLAWQKLTEKTRKLKEETEEFVKAQAKAARAQFLGANAETATGITAAERRLQEVRRLIGVRDQLLAGGDLKQLGLFTLIFGSKAKLEKEAREISDAITQGERTILQRGSDLIRNLQDQIATFGDPFAAQRVDVVRKGQAGELSGSQVEEAIGLINKLEKLDASAKGAKGGSKAADALAAVRDELQKFAAAATSTALDDLTESISRLEERAVKAGASADELKAFREQAEALIASTARSEEVDGFLGGLAEDVVHVDALKFQFAQVGIEVQKQERLVGQLVAGTKAHEEATKRLVALKAKQVTLEQKIRDLTSGNEVVNEANAVVVTETASTLEKTLGTITNIAQGALGFAQALGIADEKASAVLNNVINIARTLPDALKFINADFKGDPSALISGAGSALGLIGSLAGGLFGESPEEKARKEALQRNTLAIKDLSERIGNFGANITGSEQGRIESALNDPTIARLIQGQERQQFGGSTVLAGLREQFGITREDLEQIADEIGLEGGFVPTVQGIKNLRDALAEFEETQFADTGAGQLRAFQEALDVLDITDPTKQLRQFRDALSKVKDGVGPLSNLLAGFDLSTPAGVEQARRDLQQLFIDLTSGQLEGQLGGLTAEEFLEAIKQGLDIVDAASVTTGGTGGFNTDRSITEVTGSEIRALNRTANILAQQQLDVLLGIYAQLGGTAIRPPSIVASAPGGSAGIVVDVGGIVVNVEVTGTTTATQAQSAGTVIGAEVSRVLGDRLKAIQIANGVGGTYAR